MSVITELLNAMPQVMRTSWPSTCGRPCAHQLCALVRRQAQLPCGVCHERIFEGQSYYVIAVESNGVVRTQIHAWCKES